MPETIEIGPGNWIKLYRKVLDNPVFQDPRLLQVFIYCLCRANYKEKRILFNGEEMKLAPGEFISGRHEASKALKLKSKMWDRKLQVLENLQILTKRVTNQFSIISIINWETYQSNEKDDDQPSDQRMTNGRPTDDQPMTTDKKEKKEKKEKNTTCAEYDLQSQSAVIEILNSNRDLFHKAYPAINLDTEAAQAIAWLKANPKNRKSDFKRFLNNWLKRSQERAPRIISGGRYPTIDSKHKCQKCGKENAKSLIWEDGCSLCLQSNKKQIEFINKFLGGENEKIQESAP